MTMVKEPCFSIVKNLTIQGASKHSVRENNKSEKNLFLLHYGKVGKDSIEEMTWLLNGWTNDSAF